MIGHFHEIREHLSRPFAGQVVVIVGTGPSLLRQDLSFLRRSAIAIAVTRAYRLPEYNPSAAGWVPAAALWLDHKACCVDGDDIYDPRAYATSLATLVASPGLGDADWPNLCPFRPVTWKGGEIRRGATLGGGLIRAAEDGAGSSCIAAVHAAFALGAKRVEVIGADGGYDAEGRAHFYDPPGVREVHEASDADTGWERMARSWHALCDAWPGNVSDRTPGHALAYIGYRPGKRIAARDPDAPVPGLDAGPKRRVMINPVAMIDVARECWRGGWIEFRREPDLGPPIPVEVPAACADWLLTIKRRKGESKYVLAP